MRIDSRKDCCALVIPLKTARHDQGTTHFVTICSHKTFPHNRPHYSGGLGPFPITQAYWRETKEGIEYLANLIKGEIKDYSCVLLTYFKVR